VAINIDDETVETLIKACIIRLRQTDVADLSTALESFDLEKICDLAEAIYNTTRTIAIIQNFNRNGIPDNVIESAKNVVNVFENSESV
jgi:hypothetical protein